MGGNRTQVGDAAGHSGRGARHGVVASNTGLSLVTMPIPPGVVAHVMVRVVAHGGSLSASGCQVLILPSQVWALQAT
jgi:hypothetical protein